jgi:rhomboid protease GluP
VTAAPPPAEAPSGPRSVSLRLPTYRVWVTYALLGVIGLVFLAQFALNPFGPGADPILVWGAKENTLIAQGQVWRLVTAIFIHGSVLHFAFNAYALYNIGRQLEATYGGLRFGALFGLSGLSGSIASLLFNPYPSIGASGAIFGLIGAEAVLLYRNRALLGPRGRSALQNIVLIAGVNLLFGLQGGIDNWAHLGGLLGGLALGWVIGPVWAVRTEPLSPPAIVDEHPLAVGRGLFIVAYGLGLVVFTAFILLARSLLR